MNDNIYNAIAKAEWDLQAYADINYEWEYDEDEVKNYKFIASELKMSGCQISNLFDTLSGEFANLALAMDLLSNFDDIQTNQFTPYANKIRSYLPEAWALLNLMFQEEE